MGTGQLSSQSFLHSWKSEAVCLVIQLLRVLFCRISPSMSEEELKEAFEVYDKDGNGQITALELKQVTFPDKDPATLKIVQILVTLLFQVTPLFR